MRLVDADKYREELNAKHYESYEDYSYVIDTLDAQPTVDAIPVEWLKANFPIHGVTGTESYFRQAHIIQNVIREWEARKNDETD